MEERSKNIMVQALLSEGWDKLDKTNRLKNLKEIDPQAFRDLYMAKFGYYPNEKPKPFGVDRDMAARYNR